MAPVSVPIASRLPSSLRMASTNATVARVLGRLSRPSLLSLALDWLDEQNQALTAPYLKRKQPNDDGGGDDNDDDDQDPDFYPAAQSLEDLQDYYVELQTRKGSKREVLDRILEGDWRHGVSMYQLAMADLQYLYDHPTSQKWTAFQIVPLKAQRESATPDGGDGDEEDSVSAILDKASLVVPRFHPSSFLRNLQSQILPDIKVHYNFDRHKTLPLLVLRIFILDSPYNTSLATNTMAPESNVETSRTVYIAFPDASPYIYLSSVQSSSAGDDKAPGAASAGGGNGGSGGTTKSSEARSLRSLVVEAVPKALSRPRERYALKPTNLATRNLSELLLRRGAGRTNTAGGGWGIYADEKAIESPLNTVPPPSVAAQIESAETGTAKNKAKDKAKEKAKEKARPKRPLSPGARREDRLSKRRRKIAAARFGKSAQIDDGCGVERVDIVMQDPFPGGGRRHDIEQEDGDGDGDERERGRTDSRRKSKGGRRSQIDAVLAREDENDEADEAQRARRTAGTEDDEGDTTTDEWRPRVAFTFQGPHVFAGIRQLVEAGVIDGEKMPGWMTGEEGVTVGAVRDGRIRGHKGSGMP